MARSNKNSKKATGKVATQRQALELRRAGHGYQEIADILGVSIGAAHGYVEQAMTDARDQIKADAAEIKAEEISRLDGMLLGLWDFAKEGDVQAIDRVLKIMERRAKLLGLDAPVRVGHGGDADAPPISLQEIKSLSDADLERLIAAHSSP